MTVWKRLCSMFGFHSHVPRSTVDMAVAKARSVGKQADRLNATLRPYLDADDPFKAFAVDVFEREQEKRIHRGPGRS